MRKILSHSEPNGKTFGHVGFGTLELFECAACGCVVSDPDLHMARAHTEGGEAESLIERLRVAAKIVYPGAGNTDAGFMREASNRLEGHFEVGGSGVRTAVIRVLRVVAEAIE